MEDIFATVHTVARLGYFLSSWTYSCISVLISICTIRIPLFLLSILGYTFTLNLSFTAIATIVLVIITTLSYFWKVRYLNRYSTLKETALPLDEGFDLHPDLSTDPTTPGFHNYLDEFLSAIRVFGFLEKPVFHELARHLQTRRLLAGESLNLDSDKSFYIVVDGSVQVFAQTGSTTKARDAYDDEDDNGYQLLNSVESGGTLSSLFTILALFTEDVNLRYEDELHHSPHNFKVNSLFHQAGKEALAADPDVPSLHLDREVDTTAIAGGSTSLPNNTSPPPTSAEFLPYILPQIPKSSTSASATDKNSKDQGVPNFLEGKSVEGTIARATVDTTLAVIPAEAFRKLTKKFPNAAAHIVQVILTRLQRVTFLTAQKYLGLTRELVRTEKAINELACYPLPAKFWEGGGVDMLRQNFRTPLSSRNDNFGDVQDGPRVDFVSLDTPFNGPVMGSAFWATSEESLSSGIKLESDYSLNSSSTIDSTLLSDKDASLKTFVNDFNLKDAVMESISKAIGLIQYADTPLHSTDTSPNFKPQDPFLQKAVFNSSFGSLSFLGLQGQDDEASITASSVASFSAVELENEVEILNFPQGSVLVKAGEKNAGLYFVIEGFLEVSIEDSSPPTKKSIETNAKPVPLFTVKAGGIAGYLSTLSGFPSYVTITAKTECFVGFLPTKALERIMDRKPIILLTLAKRLISLLSPLILHIDSALDWVHVNAGQIIYRQGDCSEFLYIVINGRLRSITETPGGGVNIEGEYGSENVVGDLDCITESERPSTLHAIRDSELVRMPMTLFNAISVRHPLITIQISRIVASRVREQLQQQKVAIPTTIASRNNEMGRNNYNLKTIAILPINRHVPVSEFASRLCSALKSMGAPTSYLNQATVMQVLGRHAFTKMGTLKLAGWLAEMEQKYRIVLYVADTTVSAPWTQTCIRQADCIFLIADAGTDPSLGEYEKMLVGMKTTARKELVLLHSERNVLPGSTRPWLQYRPWIHAHHHIEMEGATPLPSADFYDAATVVALRKIAKRVEIQIDKYRKTTLPRAQPQRPLVMSDFARLARRICGKSIGIVLGGGGARGIAHLGVLRALSEQGIPIDMVGGTSIGSLVGGLYAREGDLVSTYGRTKRFCSRMSTLWRIITDLTYPVVAYTTGHEFNRGIYKSFYDVQIEDLWLPFFCNTTNITHSRMDVHTTGFCWRYVRASMSLAGLLPPLCDDGDMLVDGGYVDNLPVSIMLSMGVASVFAVDVGSVDDTSPRNYGESVSGWVVMLQRWNPFCTTPQIPNITEIQSRLTYVKTLEEAKATPGVLYMRMPVTQFGTMEFKKFTELLDIGHTTAKKMLQDWSVAGKLPSGMEGVSLVVKAHERNPIARRNSI